MLCNVMIYSPSDNGGLLAIKRNDVSNGDLRLPTGKITLGETPISAAVRILKEQTGYTADVSQLSIVHQTYENNELVLVYHVNGTKLKGSSIRNENIMAQWFTHRALMSGAFGKINADLINNI